MADGKRVLAFMAHPDDIEFTCVGTLTRLRGEAGCAIACATATTGDCGSATHRPEEISRIRYAEACTAAAVIDAEYLCADCMDLLVVHDRPTLLRFVEVIRRAKPDIVITHNPIDYMSDHEMTSQLVRAATFGAPVPNLVTEAANPAEPLAHVPHLYYVMPMDGVDYFGAPIEPQFTVDVTSAMPTKEQMLTCHASQREWLRAHHGIDQYLITMKDMAAKEGQRIGAKYGESFRQHLGHAYPHDNIIVDLLGG